MKEILLNDKRGVFAVFSDGRFCVGSEKEKWTFKGYCSVFMPKKHEFSLHKTALEMIKKTADGYTSIAHFLMKEKKRGAISVNNHEYKGCVLDLQNNRSWRQVHMSRDKLLEFTEAFELERVRQVQREGVQQ